MFFFFCVFFINQGDPYKDLFICLKDDKKIQKHGKGVSANISVIGQDESSRVGCKNILDFRVYILVFLKQKSMNFIHNLCHV